MLERFHVSEEDAVRINHNKNLINKVKKSDFKTSTTALISWSVIFCLPYGIGFIMA